MINSSQLIKKLNIGIRFLMSQMREHKQQKGKKLIRWMGYCALLISRELIVLIKKFTYVDKVLIIIL